MTAAEMERHINSGNNLEVVKSRDKFGFVIYKRKIIIESTSLSCENSIQSI